ncbi:MAG: DUF371 domain-containing protein [Promethearchaeota archaeon]
MRTLDKIYAFGHENILCSHKTTIEITKDKDLTKKGSCIIGIKASKACIDLDPKLKENIINENKIKVTFKVGNLKDSFYGFGHKSLRLLNKKDIVFRKSNYICDRTILINCTKSSNELNRELVENLKDSRKKFSIIFEINDFNGC